jgi:probable addiction module antidote protein
VNTIFIGGSRQVSRLPPEIKKRLDNVVASNHSVVIGDATGADKAVQKYLFDKHYDKVTVFCSGDAPRNNLGNWRTHRVDVPKATKGFHFYAAKDREMARAADFGLMIWDGKSPGTVLNVMRLALAGKIAVLFNVTQKDVINIKTLDNWRAFFSDCSHQVQIDVKERATSEEWSQVDRSEQLGLFPPAEKPVAQPLPVESLPTIAEILNMLNDALAHCDETAVMNALGLMARERGMSHIARETGLARESLYRSLDAKGNPEFATVLKVLSSIGLRLEAKQSFEAV